MCVCPAGQRSACGDEDQCARRSELCWSLLPALLARCRHLCGDLHVVMKISMLEEVSSLLEPVVHSAAGHRSRGVSAPRSSLVNEVQCGTGTEWRDLIGQHTPAVHSLWLRTEMG